MPTLEITIDGHQNMSDPLLEVLLVIDDQSFIIDPTRANTIYFDYVIDRIVEHKLKLCINGKKEYLQKFYQNELTQNIPDLAYIVDSIQVDKMDVVGILQTHAKYYHNTNGDTDLIVENYNNWFGCDGELISSFKTPLFAWFIVDFEF